MLDSDLSTEHQHRTRAVSRAEATRHRRFLPFLLASMVLLAVAVGWAFYIIKSRSLDLDSALFLARNRIEELRNPSALGPRGGPVGESNPQAVAEAAAFPSYRASLPKPHINSPNPIDSGLKRVLYQGGENPSFIPVSLQNEVIKAITEIRADPRHPTVFRRLHELDPMVLPILEEAQVPPLVTAVLWLETEAFAEYEDVQSRRLGLWALTPEIAAAHGMDMTQRPDPRLDPVASTRAARSYLVELFHRGGGQSWILAIMAYHEGPEVLDRIRSRRDVWSPDTLNLFAWLREELIPWELRPYLYKLLAAAVLQEEAVAFRLRPEDEQRRFKYE